MSILPLFIARDRMIDVVLIDTAGRMQDNEPLMRSLAKVCFLSVNEIVVHLWFGLENLIINYVNLYLLDTLQYVNLPWYAII